MGGGGGDDSPVFLLHLRDIGAEDPNDQPSSGGINQPRLLLSWKRSWAASRTGFKEPQQLLECLE